MGLLQRGKDGCWKRPQNEKTGGGLPGALGCTAQPPHCRKHGRGVELVPGAEPQGGGAFNRQPAPTPHPSTPSSPPCLLVPSALISPCPHLSLSLPPWLRSHIKIPLARAHLHNGRFLKRPNPSEGSPHRSLAPASRGLILLGSTRVGTYFIIMASNVCVFSISHASSISSHPFKVSHSIAKTYQAPTEPYPPFTRTFSIQSVPSPALPLDGLSPNPIRKG